jgi:SAM-dependent methyltransferase
MRMSVNGQNGTAGAGANDYDQLPYASMPYAHTQPARLAAVAALHGMETPAAQSARVLELGCASGGNIIPLALRFPDARFLGVDLARRHVEDAQRQIAELGLSNIEVQQADLAQFSTEPGQFDYLICHGVFSWAPHAVQEAIFRLCSEALTSNGVAVISYNVLPGWHLRKVIRDICLRHAGAEGSPRQRVVKAREILADIAISANVAEPYGLLLRNEARRTARRPASYILGEFLAPENAPCYFHEFAERAQHHGLAYLCEADLDASVPDTSNCDVQARLRRHAGPGALAMEQVIDEFTGRTFRWSVLTKSNLGAAPQRDWDRLRSLQISSNLRAVARDANSESSLYKDARGRAVKSEDPAVGLALARLSEAYPGTLTLARLTAPESGAGEVDAAAACVRVCEALSVLVAVGQADISTAPLQVNRAGDRQPRVWPLARAQAAAGQPWVTNLAHAPVALKPAVAVLLPHLDGSNDLAQLARIYAGALGRGEVKVPELEGDLGDDPDAVEKVAGRYVQRVLDYLETNALLSTADASVQQIP